MIGLDEVRLPATPTTPQALELPWEGSSLTCVLHLFPEDTAAIKEISPNLKATAVRADLMAGDLLDPLVTIWTANGSWSSSKPTR